MVIVGVAEEAAVEVGETDMVCEDISSGSISGGSSEGVVVVAAVDEASVEGVTGAEVDDTAAEGEVAAGKEGSMEEMTGKRVEIVEAGAVAVWVAGTAAVGIMGNSSSSLVISEEAGGSVVVGIAEAEEEEDVITERGREEGNTDTTTGAAGKEDAGKAEGEGDGRGDVAAVEVE